MEFLRLLLQFLKASLGIYVDGILCDLALRSASISWVPRERRKWAQSVKGQNGALKGKRTRLKRCLKVCGAYMVLLANLTPVLSHVQAAYPSDALGEALPAHWLVIAGDVVGIDGQRKSIMCLGMRAVVGRGSGEERTGFGELAAFGGRGSASLNVLSLLLMTTTSG